MQAAHPLSRPVPLRQLPPEAVGTDEEIATLAALAAAGLPLGSVVVVPAAVEERFYRLNNLPIRLAALFAAVDARDPDEDDVEEAVPAAQALLRQHYLLDEFIDDFYQATSGLPDLLCVRRPGEVGEAVARGRPALMALKHAYQRDWTFEAVWARLERSAAIGLDARPLLLHDAHEAAAPAGLTQRATDVLGAAVALRTTAAGAVVGVRRL